MNESEQFERRLSRQPLREIPAEWREEILGTSGRRPRAESREQLQRWPSTLLARLSTILWPHPVAWAGLAVVWVLILALDFSVPDKTPVVAERDEPSSPEMIMELRQQQRLLAGLMGPRDTGDADRSKPLAPRPRSERAVFLAA